MILYATSGVFVLCAFLHTVVLPSLGLQALYDTFSLFGNILSCKARFAACAKMGFRLEVKGHKWHRSTPEIQVLEDQNNNKLYVYKYHIYIYMYMTMNARYNKLYGIYISFFASKKIGQSETF